MTVEERAHAGGRQALAERITQADNPYANAASFEMKYGLSLTAQPILEDAISALAAALLRVVRRARTARSRSA